MRNSTRLFLGYAIGLTLLPSGNPVCADNDRQQFEAQVPVGAGDGDGKRGKTQAEYQAPGARSRYRLGDAVHGDFELVTDYRYTLGKTGVRDGAYVQSDFMASHHESFDESMAFGQDNVSQAYVNLANFLSSGVDVWMGRRHYDGRNIYLNNRYLSNLWQGTDTGFGIEGMKLGPGKLGVAMYRMTDTGVHGLRDNTGSVRSASLDVRFAGLEVNGGGTLSLWGQGVRRAAQESLGFKEKFGYGLGVSHDQKDVLGGSNTLAVTYRKGAAVVQGTFNPNPVREDQGYDLDRTSVWEVNNNFLVEPSDKLAMQWGAVARVLDFGRKGRAGSMLRWYSTGVKPIYHFTDHVNLATEFGVDYVDDEYRDLKGSVRKYTIALQLTDDREYDEGPAVRLFFTKATWSEEIKGLTGTSLGDAPYGGVTEGWTAGLQLEASW